MIRRERVGLFSFWVSHFTYLPLFLSELFRHANMQFFGFMIYKIVDPSAPSFSLFLAQKNCRKCVCAYVCQILIDSLMISCKRESRGSDRQDHEKLEHG